MDVAESVGAPLLPHGVHVDGRLGGFGEDDGRTAAWPAGATGDGARRAQSRGSGPSSPEPPLRSSRRDSGAWPQPRWARARTGRGPSRSADPRPRTLRGTGDERPERRGPGHPQLAGSGGDAVGKKAASADTGGIGSPLMQSTIVPTSRTLPAAPGSGLSRADAPPGEKRPRRAARDRDEPRRDAGASSGADPTERGCTR